MPMRFDEHVQVRTRRMAEYASLHSRLPESCVTSPLGKAEMLAWSDQPRVHASPFSCDELTLRGGRQASGNSNFAAIRA